VRLLVSNKLNHTLVGAFRERDAIFPREVGRDLSETGAVSFWLAACEAWPAIDREELSQMGPGLLRVHAPTVLVLVVGAVGMTCSSGSGTSTGAEVRVALVAPGGAHFGRVHFAVTSSGGSTIVGPADIDVSDQQATIGLDVFVPATPDGDPGDTIALTTTTNDNLTCIGTSPPFQVVAGNSTAVRVTLTCSSDTVSNDLGSIGVTANAIEADSCPSITSGVVSPDETSVGSSVSVAATASDPDSGETLSYDWAPASNFADPTAASTTYLCVVPGEQTLTLTVTDSHTPPCPTTATFTVRCDWSM
jgi:hypothetical protein